MDHTRLMRRGGENCRWTDETDDFSEIPERHADQAERIKLQQEALKDVEKTGQLGEGRRKEEIKG